MNGRGTGKPTQAVPDTTGWHVACIGAGDLAAKLAQDEHVSLCRLQRGKGVALSSPLFAEARQGDIHQMKIIYGNRPLAFLLHPTAAERETVLAAFKGAAEVLARTEREQGVQIAESKAREMAAAEIRQRLVGLRCDWKEGED